MSAIVGIDLGTTNSAVGVMVDGQPVLIPNAVGSNLTESVVGIDESGEILVGSAAKEHQVLHPEKCVSCFKRQMGTDWQINIGKHQFSAMQLSSFVLKSLKSDAETYLKTEVDRAVITVPAYFNNQQRQATIEAGKLAGFKVERIINEPTAAALAYGVHETDSEKTIAVFDLGGGTFDISIVDFFEGAVEVRASAGEAILGGEDFTKALARSVLASRSIMFEHAEIKSPAMVSRLVQQCEKAKRSLSKNETTEILVPDEKGNLDADGEKFSVDREMLGMSCKPLTDRIGIPVRRAMGDAKIARQDLNQVILVGGATRMPLIIQMANEFFGQHPTGEINPDEVVALGATIQAGLIDDDAALEDMVVVDVSPFTLGVEITKQLGHENREGYFLPIINRNTVIPTSRTHSLATVAPNQEYITLNVYQGESRMVKDNVLLGELSVSGIPKGPAGQEIEVRFTYDSNGVLEVETTVVKTKQKKRLVITKHANHLSEKELKKALSSMAKFKIHPREKTANRFVLKRAGRLFQELPSFLRDQLGMYLDVFESALDSQNPQEIDEVRNQLEIFLSVHDPIDDDSSNSDD
jgi:molecular chaperone HscC